ncbi:GDSL-type esterase/lipase family protein [Vicingaceae bacterium]|nr:GDSL-type esterase/lipase family protein [Vicingaceae bacterium]MDB4060742.1 GDSL-type esterase/lipase family protein [Vicingaceae bacterium]
MHFTVNKKTPMLFIIVLLSLPFIKVVAQNNTILIDYGNSTSTAPWNNMTNPQNGSIGNLKDRFNRNTGTAIYVTDSFRGINNSGTQSPNSNLSIPVSASRDSFFGSDSIFNGSAEPTASFEISNLDTSKIYTITIFGSRIANDNRETKYLCAGRTLDSALLNVSNNTDSVVVFNLVPSDSGKIEIRMSSGPNNTNSNGFYYIGALKMEFSDTLPPPSLALQKPSGGEYWQVGKTVKLNWETTVPAQTILEYSSDNGQNWNFIDSVPAFIGQYNWVVPSAASLQSAVRITADSLQDQSFNFEIAGNSDSCFVVVIGSSTAAGAGASVIDSAWVNRFKAELYQNDTRKQVINLARGGYTSYHLIPSNSSVRASAVGITTDTNRNITKALSFHPQAVVINLPSNDAGRNFSTPNQMRNFRLMKKEADSLGVQLWVSTTQPRNFNNSRQIQIQLDTRDSILAQFGNYAIDFWSIITDTNGHILPRFNSGDGVHLNNLGHRMLFNQAILSGISDSLCFNILVGLYEAKIKSVEKIKVYPNPYKDQIHVQLKERNLTKAVARLYDVHGRLLWEEVLDTPTSQIALTLSPNFSSTFSGMQFLKLAFHNDQQVQVETFPIVHFK